MDAVVVQAPYPPSPVIRGAVFGKEIGRAAIDSDNWPLTWGDDDAQYTFDAPEPWGPWTTVLHRQWDVPDTHGYRLPAKWISKDGLQITLVFSGVRPNDAFCTRALTFTR